ncbi:2'-5' RNA ligase family protein [Altererythrobacter sp. MF3-039]|uniref:2'-5' RNA ligase family protein n=1 Tax=Altererythrobacter sp. MF3-039 TaxID=3252901 RepID=UPI00390CC0C7
MPFETFIVTAALPSEIHSWADGLRKAHFPPERNHLQAHVTLFHALAPSLFSEVQTVLPAFARDYSPPAVKITGLMSLGKGTAIALSSPDTLAIREEIADRFHGTLTAQDQHKPRLHITIQNKVEPKEAKALQQHLETEIEVQKFAFPALELHIYRGGPWEFVKRWPFRGSRKR